MIPHQPYRRGAGRTPGPALQAMLNGRTLTGYNPMDTQRQATKKRRKRKTLAQLMGHH